MSSNYLMEQLQWFLRDDQILDTDLWREIYARDASYFNIKPMCVLRPSTTEQVQPVSYTHLDVYKRQLWRNMYAKFAGGYMILPLVIPKMV